MEIGGAGACWQSPAAAQVVSASAAASASASAAATSGGKDYLNRVADSMGVMGCLGSAPKEGLDKEQKEKNKEIEKQLEKDKQKYKGTHRLLLLGGYQMLLFFLYF